MLKRQIRHRRQSKAKAAIRMTGAAPIRVHWTVGRHTLKSVDPDVRLIQPASRQPATAVERLVVSRLKYMKTISLNSLVEAVARDLYLQELANGASVSDIGVFGPAVFSHGVAIEIAAGNGTLWNFESSL